MEQLFAQARRMAEASAERSNATTSSLEGWWGSATADAPQEAYKRFIDACRLAVEEAYTTDGDAIGSYAEAAGDQGAAFEYFERFIKAAKRQKLMPPWWRDSRDIIDMAKLAAAPRVDGEPNGFSIFHAQEVSDVRETWGVQTMLVLRSLARRIDDSINQEEDDDDDMQDDDGLQQAPNRASSSSVADIWRPSRELVTDAKAAIARGDNATACRLAFAATIHASTRGDSNSKYALHEAEIEEAMRLWTSVMSSDGVDFTSISELVNEELKSDRERPSTGYGSSRATEFRE